MKYINTFKTYASYGEKLNGGGVDISLPQTSVTVRMLKTLTIILIIQLSFMLVR